MSPSIGVRRMALWLERSLFVLGGVLALWCTFSVGLSYYYARLPIPQQPGPPQLPGDAPAPLSSAAAPARRAWIARLDAPSVALSATVLEGSDDGTLARAAGHIEDTALPGQPGNMGIAGHRDTVFRPLRDLHTGDAITLSTADRVFRYRVSGIQIVNPEDVHVLDPTNQPVITLVTCYPFEFIGHAPHRFIVHAELVSETARLEAAAAGLPGR